MRITRIVLLVLSLVIAGRLGAAGHGRVRDFTVLTFNVRSARGDGIVPSYSREHLDELARMIRELSPDAVLLQEIDRGVARSERTDQFDILVQETGLTGRFAHTVDYQGGRFGLVMLTPHPLLSYEQIVLPRYGGKEPRALQHARIAVSEDYAIDLFNVHIDPEPLARNQQIRLVLDYVITRTSGPVMLAGDFNARASSAIIGTLSGVWTDAARLAADGAPVPATFPARAPRVRVDYVFFDDETLDLLSLDYPDHRGVGDHRPILARFRVTGRGE